MQYAMLGRTGLRVSRLGFGCMRLPMKSDKEVDRDKAIPMLRRAVELGINYFDGAVMYNAGDSQRVMGEAFEDLRDRVVLSTKNHHYNKADKAGWWKNLEDSLRLLRTDCIDIYNFHGMNYEAFEGSVAGEDGLYQEMLKAREQGLIRHVGHSFHGSCESLKKCIDTGLFASVTLQYNLLDQQLEEGIAYAREHGVGIVVMGPVGGGRLGYPSDRARELLGDVKSTPELALRFVLANPGVTLALSGMGTMQMLEENVETVSRAGTLTAQDQERIRAAIQERKELAGLYCTGCNYCMPCRAGVDIPANFEVLNLERVFGLTEHARQSYERLPGQAALCVLCGQCVEKCPQGLDIPARLAEAVAALDRRTGCVAGWTDLEGGRLGEDGLVHLKLRYHLKNFTDGVQRTAVEFQPHGEDQVQPARMRAIQLKRFGRKSEAIELTIRPPVEAISLDMVVRHDGVEVLDHFHTVAAVARRAEGRRPAPGKRRPGTTHVPSPFHPLVAERKVPEGHSFDFAASYDDGNLYVWADVEDDLLRPTEGRTDDYRDNLRIFLDGRKPAEVGTGEYADGVTWLSVYPYAEEGKAPEVSVRGGGDEGVRARVARTGVGYRVECVVPWSLFSQVGGVPALIGFDLVLNSHSAEGAETVRISWTGRSGQEWHPGPRAFGRLIVV